MNKANTDIHELSIDDLDHVCGGEKASSKDTGSILSKIPGGINLELLVFFGGNYGLIPVTG
jgi:hypothetical protein